MVTLLSHFDTVSLQFVLFALHLTFSLFVETKVAGYAVGGGHVLHMVCDLTIAADNAIFGQTGPKVLCLSCMCM